MGSPAQLQGMCSWLEETCCATQAKSDTASRRSGDGQREPSAGRGASSKRKAGVDASAEQSAESLPRPSITHVRRVRTSRTPTSLCPGAYYIQLVSSLPCYVLSLARFHQKHAAPDFACRGETCLLFMRLFCSKHLHSTGCKAFGLMDCRRPVMSCMNVNRIFVMIVR
jgi:hypothetical protein